MSYTVFPSELTHTNPRRPRRSRRPEILRLLDSCQLTATHKVATPVNWKQGNDVIIVPAVSDDEAKKKYPAGWQSPLPYIRIVPQPK